MIRVGSIPSVAFGAASDGDARSDADARRSFSQTLAIPDEWATIDQVHGRDVVVARRPGAQGTADGIVTTTVGLPIAVATADCVPVALAGATTIGLVHAGWRGVASGVVPATVATMSALGDPPTRAVIGPHIGACCYEVGDDVITAIGGHAATTSWGTRSLDLAEAIRAQLGDLALEVVGACTAHDGRFASYRRDRTDVRQVTVAWLP